MFMSGNLFLFLQLKYISTNMKHGSSLEDKDVECEELRRMFGTKIEEDSLH
jgi:hypothetical protein